MSISRPHATAFVARNDASPIGEGAATRGRRATEGGDERAGARRALSVRDPTLQRLAQPHCPNDWINLSRPHPPAVVARHDAPLIGERAATRGRVATEGGKERGGAKGSVICSSSRPRAPRARRPPSASHNATPASNGATREAHARQLYPLRTTRPATRAGAARRKAAMSTAV